MLDISQLARVSGFPSSKLRYYEEVGLIKSVGRHGLKRVYENDVTMRLSLIALAQTAGFSLKDIRQMIGSEGQPELDRNALTKKASVLDAKIRQLATLSKGLRHIANCTAPNHLDCPRFQRIMRIATLPRQSVRVP